MASILICDAGLHGVAAADTSLAGRFDPLAPSSIHFNQDYELIITSRLWQTVAASLVYSATGRPRLTYCDRPAVVVDCHVNDLCFGHSNFVPRLINAVSLDRY